MSKAPSMPMFWDAYLADTTHLSTEEHGAYLLLLAAMWRRDGSVPDDDKDNARILGLTVAKWRKIKARLEPFLVIENGCISQKNLQKIWKKTQEKISKNAQNGAKGGIAKSNKNKDLSQANATNSLKRKATIPEPEPEPEQNKPPKSPKGEYPEDFEKFWSAFPSRKGNNPKRPAFKKWQGFVKGGVSPDLILQGATGYARARQGQDAQYTQQAATWLNQECWEQYAQPQKPQLVHSRETVVIEVHSEPELFDEAVRWATKYQPHTVRQGQEHIKIPAHVAANLRDSLKEIA
jgi:uncharacterized protein YdaU (DUF1376 family)